MQVLQLTKPAVQVYRSKLAAWCDYKNELRAHKPNEERLEQLEAKRFTLGPVSIAEAKAGFEPIFRDYERHREFLEREGIEYQVVELSNIEGGVVWRA